MAGSSLDDSSISVSIESASSVRGRYRLDVVRGGVEAGDGVGDFLGRLAVGRATVQVDGLAGGRRPELGGARVLGGLVALGGPMVIEGSDPARLIPICAATSEILRLALVIFEPSLLVIWSYTTSQIMSLSVGSNPVRTDRWCVNLVLRWFWTSVLRSSPARFSIPEIPSLKLSVGSGGVMLEPM